MSYFKSFRPIYLEYCQEMSLKGFHGVVRFSAVLMVCIRVILRFVYGKSYLPTINRLND